MGEAKHYGVVDGIAQYEPDSVTGNLSVSAVLASSVHSVQSVVCVGSTEPCDVNLGQLVLTAEQALQLGALLTAAGQDALSSNRAIDNLRRYGPAAARLCFALAEADRDDVLVDQSRVRLGSPVEAQRIAELAYERAMPATTTGHRDDWRDTWRRAGESLRKAVGS